MIETKPTQSIDRIFRSAHSKFRFALAAVLVVGSAVLCLLWSRASERQEFVSETDPTTGYRCRFTVASNWQAQGETFTAPNSLYHRIKYFLFQSSKDEPPTISLRRASTINKSEPFYLANGYPEERTDSPAHIFVEKHARIDGYPATFGEWEIGVRATNRATFLLVYVPNASAIYTVTGFSAGSREADREMQAIIASFHVEKTGSSGGKR